VSGSRYEVDRVAGGVCDLDTIQVSKNEKNARPKYRSQSVLVVLSMLSGDLILSKRIS